MRLAKGMRHHRKHNVNTLKFFLCSILFVGSATSVRFRSFFPLFSICSSFSLFLAFKQNYFG